MKTGFIVSVFLSFLILACTQTNSTDVETRIYVVADSLEFEFSTPIERFFVNDAHIIGVDNYEKKLLLYSKDGRLLDQFGKKGRGPGEFSRINTMDIFDDTIGIIDDMLNKIVFIQYDKVNEELNYRDEFRLDHYPGDVCILGKDKVLISLISDEKNLKLFDYSGNVLNEYAFLEPEEITDLKSMVSLTYFVLNIDHEYFLIAGIITGELYFCRFDHDDNSIEIINKTIVEGFDKLGQTFEIIERDNQTSINIAGLGSVDIFKDQYHISFSAANEAVEETFFQRYDKYGNYLGKSILAGKLVYPFTFSEEDEALCFIRNEKMYLAKEKKE